MKCKEAGRVCSMNGEKSNAYGIFVGPLQSPRCRWVNNIKMELGEDGVICIGLTRLVNMVIKLWVP
jgi:hypothetical protein